MRNKNITVLLIQLTLVTLLFTRLAPIAAAEENRKLGQSGFEFLRVVSDAHASALAGSVLTHDMRSAALFFNPATMARMKERVDLSFSLNEWIADINHQTISVALNPWSGRYGVIGVSWQSVDYGDVIGTVVDTGLDQGYRDTGIISPTAMAFGVGYAKALTDRFSVGGQLRWVRQSLGESTLSGSGETANVVSNELTPMAFDFGTLFQTGVKSLAFGMSVRNFSQEIKFAQEGFQLPLMFEMGISADLLDFTPYKSGRHSAMLSLAAVHHRSHPEQLLIGLDYRLMDLLALRLGYASANDENNLSYGFGISQFGLQLDYAYTPFGVFDSVQRVTARFAF